MPFPRRQHVTGVRCEMHYEVYGADRIERVSNRASLTQIYNSFRFRELNKAVRFLIWTCKQSKGKEVLEKIVKQNNLAR